MEAKKDNVLINDWYVVARSSDIKSGDVKKVRLLGEDIVVWRDHTSDNNVFAWQDWCPHRGVSLSLGRVTHDRLTCLYHGWQYDQTGQCVEVPSLPQKSGRPKACVKTYQCLERWNYIWVSLGEPAHDLLTFPEWENEEYRKVFLGPYYFQTSGFRFVENAFDMSHVPFLHAGSLGDPSHPIMEDYEVETTEDSVTIRTLRTWQLDPACNSTAKGAPVVFPFIKVYRPLSIKAVKITENPHEIMHWVMNVSPLEEDECLVWFMFAMNYQLDVPEAEMHKFLGEINREDATIVNSHRPARLPLLPIDKHSSENPWPAEVHAPCDRSAIAYRRWLKKLGITYGVC